MNWLGLTLKLGIKLDSSPEQGIEGELPLKILEVVCHRRSTFIALTFGRKNLISIYTKLVDTRKITVSQSFRCLLMPGILPWGRMPY